MEIDLNFNKIPRSQLLGTFAQGHQSTVGSLIERYRLVTLSATEGVSYGGKNQIVTGVSQNTASINEMVTVCYAGVTPIEFGGAVKRGDLLEVDENGRAVKKSDGYCVGMALMDGDFGIIGDMVIY